MGRKYIMVGKTTKKNDIKVEETQKVENTIVEEKAPKATEEDNTAKETAKEKAPKTEKTTAKKTTKKKASTKSTEAKKASTTAKTTTKNVPQNVYFEVYGMQTKIMVEEYEKRIKDIWLNSWNRLVKDLKEIDMYIKPEESKVYFVINGTEHGSIDM